VLLSRIDPPKVNLPSKELLLLTPHLKTDLLNRIKANTNNKQDPNNLNRIHCKETLITHGDPHLHLPQLPPKQPRRLTPQPKQRLTPQQAILGAHLTTHPGAAEGIMAREEAEETEDVVDQWEEEVGSIPISSALDTK